MSVKTLENNEKNISENIVQLKLGQSIKSKHRQGCHIRKSTHFDTVRSSGSLLSQFDILKL